VITPYYDEGGITIYHGDCRDVLPQLGAVDHVITDPPYAEKTHAGARSMKDVDAPMMTFASINADALASILAACDARRWLVATMEWRHVAQFEICPPDGWEFIRHGIWVKPDGAPQFTGDRPATGWESVALFHRPGKKRWNGGGHHAVWTCNVERGDHPTQKPIRLVRTFIELFTDPGDLILDPFMGSGTTLRAAKDLGRRAIGIEINEQYCEIAVRRLAQEVLL
jgi:site-specific DNA-methyltransferase (adenine-specific)